MTAVATPAVPVAHATAERPAAGTSRLSAWSTLARRRFSLSTARPREIVIPLTTPILFACVIAPALARSMPSTGGIDYLSFVAVGTIGLLVPLSCIIGGIGMIVDRESGAQRDLLAAPVPRSMMLLGNLSVAVAVAGFQVVALIAAPGPRGATFS